MGIPLHKILTSLSMIALLVIIFNVVFGDWPAIYLLYWFLIGLVGVSIVRGILVKNGM